MSGPRGGEPGETAQGVAEMTLSDYRACRQQAEDSLAAAREALATHKAAPRQANPTLTWAQNLRLETEWGIRTVELAQTVLAAKSYLDAVAWSVERYEAGTAALQQNEEAE